MASILDILAPSRVPDTAGIERRRGPAGIEASVRHDLQVLLNARRPPDEFTDGFSELPRSILNFGLHDYAFSEMESREKRDVVARHIETVLAALEPRLIAIRVESQDPNDMETVVRFRIFARLRGPNGDADSDFQNSFEWTTGHHEVSSA